MNPGNPFIFGSKGQGHEARKTVPAWIFAASFNSFECWRLIRLEARLQLILDSLYGAFWQCSRDRL